MHGATIRLMKGVWKSDLTLAKWNVRTKIEQWIEEMKDGNGDRLLRKPGLTQGCKAKRKEGGNDNLFFEKFDVDVQVKNIFYISVCEVKYILGVEMC